MLRENREVERLSYGGKGTTLEEAEKIITSMRGAIFCRFSQRFSLKHDDLCI